VLNLFFVIKYSPVQKIKKEIKKNKNEVKKSLNSKMKEPHQQPKKHKTAYNIFSLIVICYPLFGVDYIRFFEKCKEFQERSSLTDVNIFSFFFHNLAIC